MKPPRLSFLLALSALAASVACGTGGSIVLPNPQGNYSNASLKGSYVYQIHGFDATGPFRQIGVFTADGNGNITGGSDDSSFAATGTQVTGTYKIGQDGTGIIGINTSEGPINLAVTLASASKLQLIQADSFANAGGTAELQASNAIGTTPSGPFVFGMHQEISAQNQLAAAAEVGGITFTGGSGTGSMDENLDGSFSSPNVSATLSSPGASGRGTGTLVNSSTNFTTNFVYYIVSSGKFLMLVTNANAVGSGSAELQTGAVSNGLSGNYAFGSRGDDSTFYAGVATVGQISAASGTMTTTEDLSQDGTITSQSSISSCYTASASGRVVINDVSGNACSASVAQVFWMVNPSRAFFVNTFSVEDGTADAQVAPPLNPTNLTKQYSLAMDGVDDSNSFLGTQLLSRVGTLQFDGNGNLKLNEVANGSASGQGASSPGLISGTYTVGAGGRITATLNGQTLNLVMYAVSGSQAYVMQTDVGTITSGALMLQQ